MTIERIVGVVGGYKSLHPLVAQGSDFSPQPLNPVSPIRQRPREG